MLLRAVLIIVHFFIMRAIVRVREKMYFCSVFCNMAKNGITNTLKRMNKIARMSTKKMFSSLLTVVITVTALTLSDAAIAQQLPDPHFENWSDEFNKDIQLKDWHGSNVSQLGFKFTFLFRREGRTGYCAYVADREIGAPKLGLVETGPGYFGLGTAWQYLKGLSTGSATAGTCGGINFKYRPDSMVVWIKRTGNNTDKEDFHLLFYSWTGTSKGTQYKNKKGASTSTERINEESDIRQATDGNEFGTDVKATQIAEGWYRARAEYDNWTRMSVPVYYFNDKVPTMCNVIFSAGNYPAFRANSGLYDGNALYVDDVELVYSSKIQKLFINGEEWTAFNPNSSQVQTYRLPADVRELPTIEAVRGAGTLTNIKGKKTILPGRHLDAKEMTVTNGTINGTPTTITVKSEDGKSTTTYKIKFVK